MISPQAVRFGKDAFLLDLSMKLVVSTVGLDVTKAVVTEHMAANAYICLILLFDLSS